MSKSKSQMNDKAQNPKRKADKTSNKKKEDRRNPDNKKYDLEERTAIFGKRVIDFVKTLPDNVVNRELIRQLVKAGSSVGANYNEADGAESKKDFRHKIAICRKESKESKFWLRMTARANPDRKDDYRELWTEAQEFTLIFSSILSPKK